MPPRSHHLVALHPRRLDTAMPVAAPPGPGVADAPPWAAAPTYGAVAGGYPLLLLSAVLGLAVGLGIGSAVILL
ncbi:MAG: hypothetical protein L0G99_16010 [Propionibacteriales bacterium]|nr:hypothetical protein [Propionibacteriales bacterium]